MSAIQQWTILFQLAATLTMVGVIWFVQIVHYPLLAQVGHEQFRRYEMDHQRLTSWVVGPPMMIELVTSALLTWWPPIGLSTTLLWTGLGVLLSIWAVTYTVQIPQHAALIMSYDRAIHRRLVAGNWYRTLAWTFRGLLVLWMIHQMLSTAGTTSSEELARITSL